MKIDVISIRRAAPVLLLLWPGAGHALDVDVYGGFATGYAVQKQDAPSNDTTDTGEKAYLGTRFLGPIGIEVAYYNLGKYENQSVEVTALGATVVGNVDIRGMTLFAKAGVMGWTETDLATGTDTTGEDVTYGIGINLAVDKHILFRTELERFRKVGKDKASNDPGTEMSMLSFGINFRF